MNGVKAWGWMWKVGCGWMDVHGCVEGGCVDGCGFTWMDGGGLMLMNIYVDGWMSGWIAVWMENFDGCGGCMDVMMWMDGCGKIFFHMFIQDTCKCLQLTSPTCD